MKKYLIALVAVVLLAGTAGAQEHSGFGIKAGLNIYNVHNDNNMSFDNKLGFHAGLLAHIHLSDRFALQPEVVYSMQGARYELLNTNSRYSLDYINVPVLLQFMFAKGFRLQAGPQVGFLINSQAKADQYNLNQNDDLRVLELAATGGVSYLSPIGLGIDARYVHGFTNINERGPVISTNRGFQLGLFYLFGHKS